MVSARRCRNRTSKVVQHPRWTLCVGCCPPGVRGTLKPLRVILAGKGPVNRIHRAKRAQVHQHNGVDLEPKSLRQFQNPPPETSPIAVLLQEILTGRGARSHPNVAGATPHWASKDTLTSRAARSHPNAAGATPHWASKDTLTSRAARSHPNVAGATPHWASKDTLTSRAARSAWPPVASVNDMGLTPNSHSRPSEGPVLGGTPHRSSLCPRLKSSQRRSNRPRAKL
jgi:hypothetical protein